jgi:hypothetical protein
MINKLNWSLAGSALLLALQPVASRADCDPAQFFLQDIKSVQITDEMKIAFLQSASSSQYKSATDDAGVSLAFGPVAGKLNYDQARESARQEASLRHWSYDRSYYGNMLIKAVSPEAARQYSACLDHDQSTIGLRLSLDHVVGPYAYVHAMWIGQDGGQGTGRLDPDPVYQHVTKIRTPEVWLKGVGQTFVVERDPSSDGLIALGVAGVENSIVIPRDRVETPMRTATVVAKPIGVSSGGSSDGNSEWVRPHSAAACMTPQHLGGYLVVGSGNVTDMTRTGDASRAYWHVVTDTPQQVCIQIDSSTAAKEHTNSIKVTPIATERYPLDAERTAGG